YGVRPSDVHWSTGGLESSERKEKVALTLPPEIKIEKIAPGQTLSDMLVSGAIDALITAQVPVPFVKRVAEVKRLFANPREVEAEHFKRTGIFPIMHVMILREAFYKQHPWVAQSLYKALVEAKEHCIDAIFKNDAIHSVLPWAGPHAEEVRKLMGQDFWPYGVAANHKTLETFLRYCFEQGLIARKLDVEEIFLKETTETFKV
ncbi:MAG: ABC transporter substrate-binding protein, partial [Candidatus Binatia bacterium]